MTDEVPSTFDLDEALVKVMGVGGNWRDTPTWGLDREAVAPLQVVVRLVAGSRYEDEPRGALEAVLREAYFRTRKAPVTISTLSEPRTYEAIGERLLGLRAVQDATAPDIIKTPRAFSKALTEIMRELPGHHPKNARYDLTSSYRKVIAAELQSLAKAALEAREPTQSTDAPSAHVARPELVEAVHRALGSGDRRLCLWGASGDGKTTLAKALLRDHFGGQRTAYIDFGTSWEDTDVDYVRDQLNAMLLEYGMDAKESVSAGISELGRLTALEEPMIDLLVLDDVSAFAARRILEIARVPVLCVRRTPLDEGICAGMHVGEFSSNEAVDLLKQLLPHEDPADFALLADTLGHRAQAVALAAQVCIRTGTTARALREAVRRDAPASFSAMQNDVRSAAERSITIVYRKLLDSLKEAAPSAWSTLIVIAWLSGNSTIDNLRGYLTAVLRHPVDEYIFSASVRLLYDLSLISVTPGLVTVNRLTVDMIRWNSPNEGNEVLSSFWQYLKPGRAKADAYCSGEMSDDELRAWAQRLTDGADHFFSLAQSVAFGNRTYMNQFSSALGGFRVSTDAWLVEHSPGNHLPSNSEEETELALLVIDSDQEIRFWSLSTPSSPLRDVDNRKAIALLRCTIASVKEWLGWLIRAEIVPPVFDLDRHPFEGYSLVWEYRGTVQHQVVQPFPTAAAPAIGLAWAECGALVSLEQRYEYLELELSECPRCSQVDGDRDWAVQAVLINDLAVLADPRFFKGRMIVAHRTRYAPREDDAEFHALARSLEWAGNFGDTLQDDYYFIGAVRLMHQLAAIDVSSVNGFEPFEEQMRQLETLVEQSYPGPYSDDFQALLVAEGFSWFGAGWKLVGNGPVADRWRARALRTLPQQFPDEIREYMADPFGE